ncbi:hypothetical protein ACQCSU_11800 [Pseudarthrobacter sp. O4]|uniref:hypothetical protein n=1 Tax=Pseudarthrobacter sp. O4 TaxID=3418417 RepID=UPI003CFA979A
MSYERRLTFNLRMRGLSEAEIAGVLDDVRAHEAAAGNLTNADFSTAEDYAKHFPRKKRRTRGSAIVVIGGVLAIAYILFAILLAILFRADIREYVGPITLWPGLVLILAGTLAGFLTDYFQPAGAHEPAKVPQTGR